MFPWQDAICIIILLYINAVGIRRKALERKLRNTA